MAKLPVNKIKKAVKLAYTTVQMYYKLYHKQAFPSFARLTGDEKAFFVDLGSKLYSQEQVNFGGFSANTGVLGEWRTTSTTTDTTVTLFSTVFNMGMQENGK